MIQSRNKTEFQFMMWGCDTSVMKKPKMALGFLLNTLFVSPWFHGFGAVSHTTDSNYSNMCFAIMM